MSLLALTVPISRDEVAFSLVSRLAYRNRVPISEFLVEMGIPLPRLLIGEERALARLADISGTSLEDLCRSTPREIRAGNWSFLGESFTAEAFRSTCVRGCRACLRDDMNNGFGEGIIRGIWMLDLVRICPQHGTRLEPLWQIYDRFDRHDSAVRLQKLWKAELPGKTVEDLAESTKLDQ